MKTNESGKVSCVRTWIETSMEHITSCERGDINDGRLADFFPASKMRAILLVFVSKAAYTTVNTKPVMNCCTPQIQLLGLEINIDRNIIVLQKVI